VLGDRRAAARDRRAIRRRGPRLFGGWNFHRRGVRRRNSRG
jgi:hypothetical protein